MTREAVSVVAFATSLLHGAEPTPVSEPRTVMTAGPLVADSA